MPFISTRRSRRERRRTQRRSRWSVCCNKPGVTMTARDKATSRRSPPNPSRGPRQTTSHGCTRRAAAWTRHSVSLLCALLTCAAVLCSSARTGGADTIRVTSGVVDTAFGPPREPLDGEDLDLRAAGFEISSALEDEHAFVRLANPPTVARGALV